MHACSKMLVDQLGQVDHLDLTVADLRGQVGDAEGTGGDQEIGEGSLVESGGGDFRSLLGICGADSSASSAA